MRHARRGRLESLDRDVTWSTGGGPLFLRGPDSSAVMLLAVTNQPFGALLPCKRPPSAVLIAPIRSISRREIALGFGSF